MNKLFIILLFCCYCEGYSQLISIPSQQKAKDMVYDINTDKIYITIPTTDASNGNSIGIVNPYTNLLESTLFVGDNPTEMAISDNGQYIYVAFDGVPKIRRYTLNPLAFDIEFGLGSYPVSQGGDGDYYGRDIAVMPGHPNTIAVSRKYIADVTPDHIGIGIYEDGIRRSVDYRPEINPLMITKIKFKDANTLIGHSGTSIPSNTAFFNVNAAGITLTSRYQDMPNPHPYGSTSDFVYWQNKLYFMNGKRIDISATPYVDGRYTTTLFETGGVMYDEVNNLVCFTDALPTYTFYQGGYWNGNFKRYNPDTFELFDSTRITTAGEVDKAISCGNNCYALLSGTSTSTSATNRLVIVRNQQPLNNDALTTDHLINLYPNPSSGFVNIEKPDQLILKSIELYNILGEKILTKLDLDGFDLGTMQAGIYFCKITTAEDAVITKKIIKD